jgi:transposase
MIKTSRRLNSPGRPGLPEEIKDQVVQAYNQGGNCKAITARYGIGKSTFYRIIKERQEGNR